jgi:hypothetical protein
MIAACLPRGWRCMSSNTRSAASAATSTNHTVDQDRAGRRHHAPDPARAELLRYAAQASSKIDATTAEKNRFRTETSWRNIVIPICCCCIQSVRGWFLVGDVYQAVGGMLRWLGKCRQSVC